MKYISVLAAGLVTVAAMPILDEDLSMLSNILPANVTFDKRDEAPLPSGMYVEPSLVVGSPRTPGATVTKLSYGPFHVGANSAVENLPVMSIKSPCDECYIVALQAGLEDTEGKVINVDTGAWLHHMVMYQNGRSQKDGCSPISGMARIFASGNERTAVRTNNKLKYGVSHPANTNMGMLIDLMNISKNPGSYKITMTYEHLPIAGSGYKAADMVWNDIAGCISISEVPARVGSYNLNSQPWRSPATYKLLSATGHEHDGGTMVTVKIDGQSVCKSQQLYGRRPGYTEGGDMAMSGMAGATKHISDTGSCVDFGTLNKGQKMTITASYDTNEHPLMKKMNGQGNEPIMGISQVYLGK